MEKQGAFGIRHGDTVKIMAGRSKGKTGKVLSVNPWKLTVTVEHANHHQKAHAAESVEEHQGRHPRKRRPGACFKRDAGLPGMRQACPGGTYYAAGRD